MARPKGNGPQYQPLTIRFPEDIYEHCRAVAAEEDRSINEQVLHIVKRWIKDEKRRETTPTLASAGD